MILTPTAAVPYHAERCKGQHGMVLDVAGPWIFLTGHEAYDWETGIDEVFQAARRLLTSLETNAAPRDREIEAQKAKARSAERFGRQIPA